MAGTSKILKNIEYNREEISRTIDLLSQRDNLKSELKYYIRQKPFESAIFTFSAGVLAGLLSKRLKNLVKLVLFVYSAKEALSYLNKQETDKKESAFED